jgi:hypothetical protein
MVAARALNLLSTKGKFDTAAEIAMDVIDLLPIVSKRSLGRKESFFPSQGVELTAHADAKKSRGN